MKYINPSAGSYYWTVFDDFMSNNTGKQLVIVLGSPADYLVTRSAIGGAALGGKANMCPDNLAGWSTAVQAVVQRAMNTWGRTGLIWELWNEIGSSGPYYDDTLSLLGPYTRITAQAIWGIDPTAIISAPSLYDTPPGVAFNGWATASDGAGGTAKQWVSVGNFHSYEGAQYSPVALLNRWNAYQGYMSGVGVNWPVYVTESGYLMTDPLQALEHQRAMLTYAALGAKAYIAYSYDDAISYAVSGIATQWNAAAALIPAGAKISYLGMDSQVHLTINGSSYVY